MRYLYVILIQETLMIDSFDLEYDGLCGWSMDSHSHDIQRLTAPKMYRQFEELQDWLFTSVIENLFDGKYDADIALVFEIVNRLHTCD